MKKKDSKISINVNKKEKSYTTIINGGSETEDSNEFQWVIPSINEQENKVISIQTYKQERRKRHIPAIFLAPKKSNKERVYSKTVISVIAAIIIGVVFGFSFLKMMQGSSIWESKPHLGAQANVQGAYTVTMPERTFHLLQFGVFKEEARAKYALKGKSPFCFSIIATKEGYRVYIGVFQNEKGQADWGKTANELGYEYYNKEQVYKKKVRYVSTMEQKKVIEQFDRLFAGLLKVTSGSITTKEAETIKKQNNEFQKLATLIDRESILSENMVLMNQAVKQVEAESKEATLENRKKTQRSMLMLFSAYHELYNHKTFDKKVAIH